MQSLRAMSALVIFTLLHPWPVLSAVVPVLDLDALTNDSSLVVVGEIISIREAGTTSIEVDSRSITTRIATGTVRVDHVLKGSVPSGTVTFQHYIPLESVGFGRISPGMYSTLFLKMGTSGSLEFTSPYYPSVPSIAGVQLSGATPIDLVVSAITSTISSPATTLAQKRSALFVLSHSRSASSTQTLRWALGFADDTLRLTAAFALLQRNDLSGLPLAKEALLRRASAISADVLHNLAVGIKEGVRDPEAVADLTELLRSGSVETRRAAASALMDIRSQDAIAPLLAALGDPDREVRYYSVVGLAETTGQLQWRPNMDTFARDEGRYLNYWRQWGQAR